MVSFCLNTDHPEVAAAVREALAEAGSTDPNNFELRFNVDVLSPVVKHAEPEVTHTLTQTHTHMHAYTHTHTCMHTHKLKQALTQTHIGQS